MIQYLASKWIEAKHKYDLKFHEGGMHLKDFVPVRFSVASSGRVKVAFHSFAVCLDSVTLVTKKVARVVNDK